MRNSRLAILILVGVVAVTIVGAASARQQEGADKGNGATKITIDNFSFTPGDVAVPVGATVTWVNHDDVPHTVVSNDKKFKSKALDTDDTFSFTFTQAGTYEYYCSVHPKMTAKVTVK